MRGKMTSRFLCSKCWANQMLEKILVACLHLEGEVPPQTDGKSDFLNFEFKM